MITQHVDDVLHWVMIKVFDKRGGQMMHMYYWKDMPFELRMKYDWYFKYRAALAQVKNPKCIVDFTWGNVKNEKITLADKLKREITYKKGKLTRYQNQVEKFKKAKGLTLFSIEDYPAFIKANGQINRLKNEIRILNKLLEEQKSEEQK